MIAKCRLVPCLALGDTLNDKCDEATSAPGLFMTPTFSTHRLWLDCGIFPPTAVLA